MSSTGLSHVTCGETIAGLGLDIRPPRSRVDGESDSIYFHDHDGHLFELHAGSLRERLAVYSAGAPSGNAGE